MYDNDNSQARLDSLDKSIDDIKNTLSKAYTRTVTTTGNGVYQDILNTGVKTMHVNPTPIPWHPSPSQRWAPPNPVPAFSYDSTSNKPLLPGVEPFAKIRTRTAGIVLINKSLVAYLRTMEEAGSTIPYTAIYLNDHESTVITTWWDLDTTADVLNDVYGLYKHDDALPELPEGSDVIDVAKLMEHTTKNVDKEPIGENRPIL